MSRVPKVTQPASGGVGLGSEVCLMPSLLYHHSVVVWAGNSEQAGVADALACVHVRRSGGQ